MSRARKTKRNRGQETACSLRLDFCSLDAVKHALASWYYRPEVPRGKTVRIGVWEAMGAADFSGTPPARFVGVIIFGLGTSNELGKAWGLKPLEACEMVRIALAPDRASSTSAPSSKIVAIALKLLKKQSPGLRAVVSYSDPAAGHIGTIYQAGNWIYLGLTNPRREFFDKRTGKQVHSRWVSPEGLKMCRGQKIPVPRPQDCRIEQRPGKHRYVFPLDGELRARLETIAVEYPKRQPAPV